MREIGIVKKIEGDVAIVTLDKKPECSKCGMCLFPKNVNKIDIRAKNQVNAQEGETVTIEKNGDGKLTGAVLAFLIPLLLIGISAIIGGLIIKKEIWIIVLSLILVVLWYTFLALFDKKLAFLNKFSAVVVEINKTK